MPGEGKNRGRDIVVMGASAGGVEALRDVFARLEDDLPAAVLVVLHLAPGAISVLPAILDRAGALRASAAEDGEALERGRIYVAVPDCHLQIEDGRVQIVRGPRENGHRPAIDPLFRTAAHEHGSHVIGVVLSGTLDDGTLGLRSIKAHGGTTIVQDPATALHSGMPRHAIEYAEPDRVLGPEAIAAALEELARQPVTSDNPGGGGGSMNPGNQAEEVARGATDDPQPGNVSGFTCPECGGAVWEQKDGNVLSYRCRVGHSYGSETFLVEQGRHTEAALWAALRLVEERIALMRRLAERFSRQTKTTQKFKSDAENLERHAVALRGILGRMGPLAGHAELVAESD